MAWLHGHDRKQEEEKSIAKVLRAIIVTENRENVHTVTATTFCGRNLMNKNLTQHELIPYLNHCSKAPLNQHISQYYRRTALLKLHADLSTNLLTRTTEIQN